MHGERLIFRTATEADAVYVGSNLRSADALEVHLLSDRPPAGLVLESMQRSIFCRVHDVNGVPAAIFGVAPGPDPDIGHPWLLGTDALMTVAKGLARESLPQVLEMQALFPRLLNQVHRANVVSINWLRWMGFVIGETPCGPGNEFLLFWRNRNV